MEETKLIIKNKKAYFNYKIIDQVEAGIILLGSEVKSLRMGKANITDAYAKFTNGEVWLVGCHISLYPYSIHYDQHNPERGRKLLFHKYEIKKLSGKIREQGMSLIPLSIYFKKDKIKIKLALAKGKKKYDKRHAIKKREQNREMRQH